MKACYHRPVSAAGLSNDPAEYRRRLEQQTDERVDAWAAELMRDMSIRRGVLSVLAGYKHAAGLDDRTVERVFAAGGGPPAAVGHTADGQLMVPAISLRHLVAGTRQEMPDATTRLIDYLVANFHELVYI